MLQPVYKYFRESANSDHISQWKGKVLSAKIIKLFAAFNNSLDILLILLTQHQQ